MSSLHRIVCWLIGHDERTIGEYENAQGVVEADFVCERCGNVRLGWTGPEAEYIRSLGMDVPQKEDVYADVHEESSRLADNWLFRLWVGYTIVAIPLFVGIVLVDIGAPFLAVLVTWLLMQYFLVKGRSIAIEGR